MKIKDYYDGAYLAKLSAEILEQHSDFDARSFVAATEPQLDELEYKARVTLIAEELHAYLPGYSTALDVFSGILGNEMPHMGVMYDHGMRLAPIGRYIELHATAHPEDYGATIEFIRQLTKRYSGEFALRPVLREWPEQTLGVIGYWSRTEDAFVRRLCSEALRIKIPWGPKLTVALEYFTQYKAILTTLVDDENTYVRRSVANNLNELTKEDFDLGRELIREWESLPSPYVRQVVHYGTRYVRKKGLLERQT